jgi:predicted dithiol-disulfide oxidoreductase (DUF899 family)
MLPEIVSETEWRTAHEALLDKEKQATRERDALAAERRRQPMTPFPADFTFEGPAGAASLVDLFEGRSQLLVYHFWFPEDGEACPGCTMFSDQVSELAHLNARDVTFAAVSRAPQDRIAAYRERMGWSFPWHTGTLAFQEACGTTEFFKLQCFLRDGDDVYLTYETTSRGVEALGSVWTFLDLTPLGRQEEWEDTPPGRPQGPAYSWWRRHDEYAAQATPAVMSSRQISS